MKKRTKVLLLIAATAFLLFVLAGFWNGLAVRRYAVDVPGLPRPVRAVLVTDLHSCAYGKDQRDLVGAVEREAPDIVLLGGDIFDDELPDGNTVAFLKGICGKYPCFYVTGNHEYWSGAEAFAEKMAVLEECGIQRLSGDAVPVDVDGARITVCGVDDPSAWLDPDVSPRPSDGTFDEQLAGAAAQAEDGTYTILLSHRPELHDVYTRYDFDLVLAGHAHGGQFRIPGILNGLFAPGQGFFPRYAGGRYDLSNGSVMIVSRGLARESTRLPRWYNRPELVVIDIRPPKA